jgi:hypothetical protein
MNKPPRRYVDGIAIAKMDSRIDWGNPDDDYSIKTLFVRAEESEVPDIWLLVAFVEVEVFGNEDEESDDFTELGKEVYRLPFPFDLQTRKTVLRLLREQPSFSSG